MTSARHHVVVSDVKCWIQDSCFWHVNHLSRRSGV